MWRKWAPANICPKGIMKTTSDKTAHTWIEVQTSDLHDFSRNDQQWYLVILYIRNQPFGYGSRLQSMCSE